MAYLHRKETYHFSPSAHGHREIRYSYVPSGDDAGGYGGDSYFHYLLTRAVLARLPSSQGVEGAEQLPVRT